MLVFSLILIHVLLEESSYIAENYAIPIVGKNAYQACWLKVSKSLELCCTLKMTVTPSM